MLVANESQMHKWATEYSPITLDIYKDYVVIAENCEKSKGKQVGAQSRLVDDPIVKRFKGSSNNNTTVLEHEDHFPSSFSSDEPDSSLRPMSFSEANTMILEKIEQSLVTPTRRISFVGDSTGMSQTTNVPYQPLKLTWQNKVVVTGNKLRVTKEKMKTRKGNGKSQT
ncbi:hypothetical protein K7X08_034427 [Anisodus acutangulus]|uniref:Uncharacterized protein n=1 Tax=Anisodus acutangulus TaxID=402998 RepID=A0A9Q1R1E7_9SOLA|nr:hypothetical protein K7X08_034427 [Anisodus acutangulus]